MFRGEKKIKKDTRGGINENRLFLLEEVNHLPESERVSLAEEGDDP